MQSSIEDKSGTDQSTSWQDTTPSTHIPALQSIKGWINARTHANVDEIIDRWLDLTCSYFKLRGDDGGIYILRYDRTTDTWQITLFSSCTYANMRLSTT